MPRAELALEFSLSAIPAGPSECDSLEPLVGDRDDSGAPIRLADFDCDQPVALQRPKTVSHRGAIHGHEFGNLQHRLRIAVLEMAQDRVLSGAYSRLGQA